MVCLWRPHRMMICMQVRHKDGGEFGEDFIHIIAIVTTQLAERSLPTIQQQRLRWAEEQRDDQTHHWKQSSHYIIHYSNKTQETVCYCDFTTVKKYCLGHCEKEGLKHVFCT